jgi:hypothetical protein
MGNCTATSVLPAQRFVEFSFAATINASTLLPNQQWTTYSALPPQGLFVLTNGTRCASLRSNGSDPYLEAASCKEAPTVFAVNASDGRLQAGGWANTLDQWMCLGAVEPNPVVRAVVAAGVLGQRPPAVHVLGPNTVSLTFPVMAGQPADIVLLVPVYDCGSSEATVAACAVEGNTLALLQSLLSTELDANALWDLHASNWAAYWDAMQVREGDDNPDQCPHMPAHAHSGGWWWGGGFMIRLIWDPSSPPWKASITACNTRPGARWWPGSIPRGSGVPG